jgi:hypothetical protein
MDPRLEIVFAHRLPFRRIESKQVAGDISNEAADFCTAMWKNFSLFPSSGAPAGRDAPT